MTEFFFDAPLIAPMKTRHDLHQTNLVFNQTSHYKLDCTGCNHRLYEGEQILRTVFCVVLCNKFPRLLTLHIWDDRQMLISNLMQFDFQTRLRDIVLENQRWMCWYLWFTDENNFLSFFTWVWLKSMIYWKNQKRFSFTSSSKSLEEVFKLWTT